MVIRKIILAGLLLLSGIFPAMHAGQAGAENPKGEAASVTAMKRASAGFIKLATLAAEAEIEGACGKGLGALAHQIRLARADVELSGQLFSDLAAASSSQGQQSGLYGDAMDSLARMAATVDDILLLTAELIVACADPAAKDEAAELKSDLTQEAQAASGEALQAAKLQEAFLFAYGEKSSPLK